MRRVARRVSAGLLVALGVAGQAGLAGPAAAQGVPAVLTTSLSGAEAVPPGDPDGSGNALLVVDPGGTVCFVIFARGIAPITGVHVHSAPPGEIGGHAVDLFGPIIPLPGGGQLFTGCVQGEARADEVAATPSDYYLNVHTAEFPTGALRGQLGD